MAAVVILFGRDRGMRSIYAYAILLEALLLAALGAADLLLPIIHRGSALVIGLSFLMGLQNATTTMLSNAGVRTTHVSGMAIEIATIMRNPSGEGVRNLLLLHGSTLLAFLFGGIAGVLLYLVIQSWLLLLLAVGLGAIALPYLRRPL